MRVDFDLLRHDLAENQRLGKILGSNNDPVRMRGRTPGNRQGADRNCQHKRSAIACSTGTCDELREPAREISRTLHRGWRRFSTHPRPKPAKRASPAAAIAPDKMS